jgi:hypothetical protein
LQKLQLEAQAEAGRRILDKLFSERWQGEPDNVGEWLDMWNRTLAQATHETADRLQAGERFGGLP